MPAAASPDTPLAAVLFAIVPDSSRISAHPMLDPRRILRWMYIGRLSVATAIFVAAVTHWQEAEKTDTLVAALVLFGAVAFTAGSAWRAAGRDADAPWRLGRAFLYAQPLFDIALVTAVIHITGGAASQFAALYILVIAGASLVLPAGGGLLIALAGSLLYCADAIWGQRSALDLGLALQLAVFAAVALGIAYISARLREAGSGREELEAQLVLARLQADDILRNIASGILTVDAEGRLLYLNPAAAKMLGVQPNGAIGRPVADALAAAAPGLARALQRAVAERIRVTRGEATISAGGRSSSIGFTTTTIEAGRDPAGVSATAIFQDITDNKRLEALRLRAERLEGVAELSASLAHEIKNPLASIRSAVEQLALAPRTTEDERVLAGLIVRESDRLSRLLSEFLDFARVRVPRAARVDVGAVARAAANLAGAHPDRKTGVEVTCIAPQEPLLVEGDEDLLHRAVFNIVLNAVQAVPEQGHVRIEAARLPTEEIPWGGLIEHDAVALRISDDGPGIPDEIRERVFDPFFTTKEGGTGLGLPIVHRAIDAHRGVVLLESGPDGTHFTVLLPHSSHTTDGHTTGEPA